MIGRYDYPNGYSAVVTRGRFAKIAPATPYALVVMAGNEKCFDTPVASGELGYLSGERVSKLLAQVESLPARA